VVVFSGGQDQAEIVLDSGWRGLSHREPPVENQSTSGMEFLKGNATAMASDTSDMQFPWPPNDEQLQAVFQRMLVDGSWGRYRGPHVDALTAALAEYHAVDHCLVCCSGTAAVELSLRAAGVSAGDDVLLCAYDFKSNLVNVLQLGAIPVLVDSVPGQPLIDVRGLEAAVTPRAKALIVSHLHGLSAPMAELRQFCETRSIVLIEDACQNAGALLEGRRAGAHGDLGVLSFGGSKLLTAGRGGAILTSSKIFAQRIHLYNQRGNDAYPLSEMQAAVLLPQLRQLDERNEQRAGSVDILRRRMEDNHVLRLVLPAGFTAETSEHGGNDIPAFYKLAFLLSAEYSVEFRGQLSAMCIRSGIPLYPGFSALQAMHAKSRYRGTGSLENSAELGRRLMVLHHPVLLQESARIESLAQELCRILRSMRG